LKALDLQQKAYVNEEEEEEITTFNMYRKLNNYYTILCLFNVLVRQRFSSRKGQAKNHYI